MKYEALVFSVLLLPVFVLAHQGEEYIFLNPASVAYEPEDEIAAEVWLDAPEPITSFRIQLTYDPLLLEVLAITPDTESFPFWWKQEAKDGIAELEASAPSPGREGDVRVAQVRLKALRAGNTLLSFSKSGSLLLNKNDENLLEPREAEVQSSLPPETPSSNAGLLLALLLLAVAGIGGVFAFRLIRRKKGA